MMIMKLDQKPFELTKQNKKIVEVRLSDEKRKNLVPGHTIKFTNQELGEITVDVLAVRKYKDIIELVSKEDISKTGGLYKNEEEWIEHILSYYPIEKQRESGLLAIEIKIHQ